MDKKTYATVSELLSWHVSPVVASTLAPYKQGGVEFILDKEGRALLVDEIGLEKTVQAIAAMGAFQGDWPLLVFQVRRYHWELEFRQWMGREAKLKIEQAHRSKGGWGVGGIIIPNYGESRTSARKGNDLTMQ